MTDSNETTLSDSTNLRPDQFRIGKPDNAGETVAQIYSQSRDYVIYRTATMINVDIWDQSPNYAELKKASVRVFPYLGPIYSRLPMILERSEPILKEIARAVAMNLRGEPDEAIRMLRDVLDRATRLKLILGRLQYSISCLAVAVLTLVACHPVFERILIPIYLGEFRYVDVAVCGAMGGFFSVILRYGSLEIDLDANWKTNCLIGASRILIAMVAAVFATFVVVSGIALQPLASPESPYGILAVAMIAGFSEGFVPNIMDNLASGLATNPVRPQEESPKDKVGPFAVKIDNQSNEHRDSE